MKMLILALVVLVATAFAQKIDVNFGTTTTDNLVVDSIATLNDTLYATDIVASGDFTADA